MGSKKSAGIGTPIIYFLLIATLAFFEYGKTLDGLMGGLLLALVFTLTTLVGLIPFLGIPIYFIVAGKIVEWWSAFTGLSSSSFTVSIAYWLGALGAVILNIVVTLIIILFIRK